MAGNRSCCRPSVVKCLYSRHRESIDALETQALLAVAAIAFRFIRCFSLILTLAVVGSTRGRLRQDVFMFRQRCCAHQARSIVMPRGARVLKPRTTDNVRNDRLLTSSL